MSLLTQPPLSFLDTQLGSQPTTSVDEVINQRRLQPRVRSGQLADGIRVTGGKWGVYISFGSETKRKNAGIQPFDRLSTNTSWASKLWHKAPSGRPEVEPPWDCVGHLSSPAFSGECGLSWVHEPQLSMWGNSVNHSLVGTRVVPMSLL